ncbi:cysteine-rich receptor-like protein kinase 42 isoform X2 [Populus nigra]|uniref:cysteine-rich receptor-like protein kinase 42 isoform X2 n=1 Tax=Populus nigra TaxID=3691 RepID=UPI002B276B5D|nr:cysteine-rich receptor-like protein kinase 42 isoform X2 [Populus nigra]
MFPEKIEQQQSVNHQQRTTNTVPADKVVIAVKAEKVISKTALAWALTHVVHPGDGITLLAVFTKEKSGKRFWNFPRLAGDCGSDQRKRLPDCVSEISENCSQMMLQFHNLIEVGVRIKVVSSTPGSVVVAEARRNGANWVVLDKKLKQELKHCIEELRCNIVVMKGSQAKVLRLNLGCSNEVQNPYYSAAASPEKDVGMLLGHRMKHSTPVSSPEEPSTPYSRTGEGNKRAPLDWNSRLKIAIGTARGLRYLHEDCRVGCVVHRDMRPHNILVTHNFEPLVADFGLARWHAECTIGIEERVIGTSGYVAPEYTSGGKITQKADVFSFGLVLLELMTGQRISMLQFYRGRNFLSDCFHPVTALEPSHVMESIYQLLDPCLASEQLPEFACQLQAMGLAASLCLRQDPETRPPMSKVLGILEGGDLAVPLSLDVNSVGNRSGRLRGLSSGTQPDRRRGHSRKLSH